MRCPVCSAENPETAELCRHCAAPLTSRCPSCGATNTARARFCSDCATPLTPQIPGLEAERRQLSVMFCDLAGSTALAERLDPEDLRELVRAYQETCAQVIERFEGHVAQYLGDGLLVYFGYPQAHEDDGARAIRAGLEILEALARLNTRLEREGGVRLPVRIGIHSGLVVVGEVGGGARHERLALGETPNVAARLQSLAEPDTVVISAATHRLVGAQFACEDSGTHDVKGVSAPLRVYRVLGESVATPAAPLPAAPSPLVGREPELARLLACWARASAGQGQAVLLTAEPGIGKSRLIRELSDRLAGERHTWLEGRASDYHRNSPLYPVIQLVQRLFGLEREDSAEARISKVDAAVTRAGLAPAEAVPLMGALLSLPVPDRYPPLALAPLRQRQRTLETVLALLAATATRNPVVVVMEDLQWADPSTQELLGSVVDQVSASRTLVLLVARPGLKAPWMTHPQLVRVTLERLTPAHVEALIDHEVGGGALPAEVRQQLVSKTDGVPLFVEELTRMVLESGLLRKTNGRYELAGPLSPLAIPATLHHSLMARLDRLGPAKPVAQLAATLGREFRHELLRAVSPVDEASLQERLDRLVDADLLHRRGVPPNATYTFRHAMIQDTAYQSLLKSTRRRYHEQIAHVLPDRFPELVEAHPELLAHHLTEAELPAQAIAAWHRAGQTALGRSANAEAINHLTRGLELLAAHPEVPHRVQQELGLQAPLGAALLETKGFGAPEVGATFHRARELCQHVSDAALRFPALRGLYGFYLVRGEMRTTQELGEELLRLATETPSASFSLEAHHVMGVTAFHMGHFVPAREHFDRAIALYDLEQHRGHAYLYGYDPGVSSLAYAAATSAYVGRLDEALETVRRGHRQAQAAGHLFSLAYSQMALAWIHLHRGEAPETQEWAAACLALATEQGFPHWAAWGNILHGWASAAQGRADAGISQIRRGLEIHRSIGSKISIPTELGLLAEACLLAGRAEEGLAAVAEGLAEVESRHEAWWHADLWRLRGDLRRSAAAGATSPGAAAGTAAAGTWAGAAAAGTAAAGEAEGHARMALAIAREQGAPFFELKATMSLAQLLRDRRDVAEARRLLSGAYGRFQEGLTTPLLADARTLLDTLR
jgi:class 3 adenylate cyclase/predicted ATPase